MALKESPIAIELDDKTEFGTCQQKKNEFGTSTFKRPEFFTGLYKKPELGVVSHKTFECGAGPSKKPEFCTGAPKKPAFGTGLNKKHELGIGVEDIPKCDTNLGGKPKLVQEEKPISASGQAKKQKSARDQETNLEFATVPDNKPQHSTGQSKNINNNPLLTNYLVNK